MRIWKLKIYLGDLWIKDERIYDPEVFKNTTKAITERLKKSYAEIEKKLGFILKDELEDLVIEMEDTDDVEEFNDVWDRLYDWADTNSVWIDTFSNRPEAKG